MFIDVFGENKVNFVTLIEPSKAALKRAALHIINDVKSIKTINKGFDDLDKTDLNDISSTEIIDLHLFSNVIDMDFFNLSRLIEMIEKNFIGTQYVIVSSPYIDAAKTERINLFITKLLRNNGTLLLEETKVKGNWINGWSKVIRVIKFDL